MAVKRPWARAALLCALLGAGLCALAGLQDVRVLRCWINAPDAVQGAGPLIVIDAGHGGMDGGAVGRGGVVEAPLNLAVAKLVESGLRERGYRVCMTRGDEHALGRDKQADMQQRRKLMRQEGTAAIVSIHMNKFRDTGVKGPRVFYMRGSEQGKRLALLTMDAVCEAVGFSRRIAAEADYFMLRESIAPAIIVECGFLSNASELAKLQDAAYQKKLADGVVAGIIAYVNGTPAPEA